MSLRHFPISLLLLTSAVFAAAQDNSYNTVDADELSTAVDPFDWIPSLQPNLNDLIDSVEFDTNSASIDSAAGSRQPNNNPLLSGQISFGAAFGGNNRLPPAPSSSSSSSQTRGTNHLQIQQYSYQQPSPQNDYTPQQQQTVVSAQHPPAGYPVTHHHSGAVQHSTPHHSSSSSSSQYHQQHPRHIPAKYRQALAIDEFWYDLMAQTYQHVDVAILLDDSGSMCSNMDGKSYENRDGEIDPSRTPRRCKRWQEANEWLDVMLAAIQVATHGEKSSTVSFLNSKAVFRGVVYGNDQYNRLKSHIGSMNEYNFGGTPSGRAMQDIFQEHRNRHDGQPHPLVVYFITDGDPSDSQLFDQVVKGKPMYYFIAIRATTDRENDIEHLNQLDKIVANFDVSDDYLDERREIVPQFQEMFDYPRYVLKFLMGPFISELDVLDEALGRDTESKVKYSHNQGKRQQLKELRSQVVQAIDWDHRNNYHVPATADQLEAVMQKNNNLIRAKPLHLENWSRSTYQPQPKYTHNNAASSSVSTRPGPTVYNPQPQSSLAIVPATSAQFQAKPKKKLLSGFRNLFQKK